MSTNIQLRIVVERGNCCGYGLCAAICPEIYKLDEGGLVYVESELVPAGMEEAAREGAEACPAEALKVEAVAA
jgi:ferredoxin